MGCPLRRFGLAVQRGTQRVPGPPTRPLPSRPTGVGNRGRIRPPRRGVQVSRQVCGWEDWPRWEGYDHVVAIFVQFSAPDERTRMFERMATSLLPGGHLHLLGYSQKQPIYGTGGPKDAGRLYDAALLNHAFPSLRTLELSQYETALDEGSAHRGPSALIGYVGRLDA